MAGKLEFTQFDPVVAENSGSQGLKWEGNSIKRVENELNWIESSMKSYMCTSAYFKSVIKNNYK